MEAHHLALQHLRAGNWQAAHVLVQALEDKLASHLHALVHRLEGDQDNARYWYGRAGIRFDPSLSVIDELDALEQNWPTGL